MTLAYPHRCFPGRILTSREVGDFFLTLTTYAPGLKLPTHSHERACFVIAFRGSFSETYGKRSRQVKPSTLIFRPAGEAHSEQFNSGGAHCLNIEIEQEWLQRAPVESALVSDSADYQSSLLTSLSLKLCHELRETDAASTLSIEGLTLEIIAAASRGSVKQSKCQTPKWLEQAREFIHAHFAESLTLAQIAELAAVHPVHLAREFRKHFHSSPANYITQLRIELACRELAKPDTQLAHVASATGFYDQSHFSKTFKRLTGMTPTRYRMAFHSH